MPTTYTIYIQNKTTSMKTFWCFLAKPQELVNDTKVFANSDAALAIRPDDPGLNSFSIPVQYIVGAGASNNAVD